jgi:hypothetical protein
VRREVAWYAVKHWGLQARARGHRLGVR